MAQVVIPAEAGIRCFQYLLDPRFRGGDVILPVLTIGNHVRQGKVLAHMGDREETFLHKKVSSR